MKFCVVTILLSIYVLTGCSTHYYRQQGDHLTLYLKNCEAREVYFFHSQNGFDPIKAMRNTKGIWEISIIAHETFSYFFQVDGETIALDCELKETDDFGSRNCIFECEKTF